MDLHRWLASEPSRAAGRHPLPTPELFAQGMGLAGIGNETTVVAYDDQGGVIAARLVWMLRALDQPAALLDGGLSASAGPLSVEEPAFEPAVFVPRSWPTERLVSVDDVASSRHVLIDARQHKRYLGEPDGVDPRAGHIPGAKSVPTREHLDTAGFLRPAVELRETFSAAGIEEDIKVISYCGSGVTACHNLLVLEYAGLGQHSLYPGSWSQWANSDRPLATTAE